MLDFKILDDDIEVELNRCNDRYGNFGFEITATGYESFTSTFDSMAYDWTEAGWKIDRGEILDNGNLKITFTAIYENFPPVGADYCLIYKNNGSVERHDLPGFEEFEIDWENGESIEYFSEFELEKEEED